MNDDQNITAWLQTMPTDLVRQIAEGSVDVQRAAKHAMADRGCGRDGKWVGFKKAAEVWMDWTPVDNRQR